MANVVGGLVEFAKLFIYLSILGIWFIKLIKLEIDMLLFVEYKMKQEK